jgi:L-fucose mutarotase/ribose pyranase (RbsD/FucU family)
MLLGLDPVLSPDLPHIVQTGERRFQGDILLTKGVVPPEEQA